MKIPNADNLAKVPSSNVVIPTIESETNSCEIIIVMNDETIGQYVNEGTLDLIEKYDNINKYCDEVGLMESDLPEIDKLITKDIQKIYPNVKEVYILNL